jgi:ABC-2 type transport system permease protein
MNIAKTLNVARWEFVEKARSKAFIASLVLTPIIMAAFATLPSLLMLREDSNTKRFAVYDAAGNFVQPAQAMLNERYKLKEGTPEQKPAYELVPVNEQSLSAEKFFATYAPRIFKEEFTGLLVIPADVATTRSLEYRSDNVGNIRDIERIERTIKDLLNERSAFAKGIDAPTFKSFNQTLDTKTVKISKDGVAKESGFLETFALAYGSIMLMFILITYTGQLLVRGLMEEKNNRIMEILVSSVSPFELMMGKLIGLSGVGIVQAVAWVGGALAAMAYFGKSIDAFMVNLPMVALFSLLGYVLYASILLGIGSVTTTEQEAQQVTGYVMMMLMLPMFAIGIITQNPNSTIARVLSFVPFTAPSAMIARMSILMPAWWEIALSLALLVGTIVAVVFVAAKIFRVAILVYGKRPTLPEVLSFLREQ